MQTSANESEMQPTGGVPSAGFTLIEIMLAMGIMAVGMAMVAALFPAAILQSKDADHYTKSVLISRNAEAVICAEANYAGFFVGLGDTEFHVLTINDTPGGVIHSQDATYPTDGPPADSSYGWVALVRRVTAGANDYQFVVIPFRKLPSIDYGDDDRPDDPQRVTMGLDADPDEPSALFEDADDLAVGSPVVVAAGEFTGRFAFIERVDGEKVYLSNTLGVPNFLTDPGGIDREIDLYVLRGGGESEAPPAIGCYVFRTALRETGS